MAVWYTYDKYTPGAVWGHVARDLAEIGPFPESNLTPRSISKYRNKALSLGCSILGQTSM